LRWGSLRLNPFINQDPLFDLSRQPHWVVLSNGHYYSKFSPIPSLLALPVYAPYVWVDGAPNGQIYLILSWFVAILISAVVTAILFCAPRRLVASGRRCSGAFMRSHLHLVPQAAPRIQAAPSYFSYWLS
jgi:hypothetical protein